MTNITTGTPNLGSLATSAPDAVKFQHYSSAKAATKFITDTGQVVCFINFQFITSDKSVMAYLDSEIAAGNTSITKGELMTAEEADPMSALKRKHIAEYQAAEAEKAKAAALGEVANMGDTKPKDKHVNVMSTSGVASGLSNSNTTTK